MNVAVGEFQETHLAQFDSHSLCAVLDSDLRMPDQSLARTFYLEGKPCAAAGVRTLWPGVGAAWTWIGEECLEHHMLSFTRTLRRDLMPLADVAFKRIQAEVAAGDRMAERWIELMGFVKEFPDPMRRYGLGGIGDYCLYVRFPDG